MPKYELLITNAALNDLTATIDNTRNREIMLKTTQRGNPKNILIKTWLGAENCHQLTTITKLGQTQTLLNFNISFYLENPEKQVIVSHDEKTGKRNLQLPFPRDVAVLNIGYERNDLIGNSAWIYFTAKKGSSFAKWNVNYKLPYLAFPLLAEEADIFFWMPDLSVVIELIQSHFHGGITLATRSTINNKQIGIFVAEIIRSERFEFHNFDAGAEYNDGWKALAETLP